MAHLVAVALLLVPVVAIADDDPPRPEPPAAPAARVERGFVGGGILIGADHFFHAALSAEGGVVLGGLPLAAHGMISAGDAFDFEGGGRFLRAIGGLEARGGAMFVDLDLGYQRMTWSSDDPGDMLEHHRGLIVAVRVGLDAGGERLRFRGAIEAVRYDHHSNVNDASWEGGFGLSLGLAYRL